MAENDFDVESMRNFLDQYETYEAYLDSFVTLNDLNYLGNIEVARQLIELGVNIKAEILTKENFLKKKQQLAELRKNQFQTKTQKLHFKCVKDPTVYESDPFLAAIAKREEDIVNGRLLVIIFIRAKIKKDKQKVIEISGYIDLADRLKTEDFVPYYEKHKVLLPRKTDLSYYNWNTGTCYINDSRNFKNEEIYERQELVFKNKRDRKAISIGTERPDDENSSRTEISSSIPEYEQIVIFDHYSKRKQ